MNLNVKAIAKRHRAADEASGREWTCQCGVCRMARHPKKKPLEFWVVIDGNGHPFHMDSRAEALRLKREWNQRFSGSGPHRVVFLREAKP